jgi:hypothetical protein
MAMKAVEALFKSTETREKEKSSFYELAIKPLEGVEIFSKVVSSRLKRAMIYPFDLGERLLQRDEVLKNYDRFLENKFKALTQPKGTPVAVALTGNLSDNVLTIWKDDLGYKDISIHDNIFELGASSLDVVQINNIFKSALNIDVPVTALFEHPTIHSFLKYLNGTNEGDVTAPSGERIDRGKNKLEKLKKISNVER